LNVPTNSVTLTNATILGAGSLTKSGNSSATIGNSSYTGPTVVTGGTLFSGGANFLSDSSHVQLTGTGNLSLKNNNDTIPSLSSNTGTICSIGTATLTLAANDGGTYTHGGIISGTGNVIKNGDHTAVFASANTYTGTTTVNAGVLRMSGSERLDDASDLIITGGAVELFGATETVDTLTMTGGELGTFANPTGTLIANTFNLQGGNVRHTLAGSGNLTKTNNSLNALISTGGHTYGGSTTISGGILTTNAADVIPDTSGVTVNSPGVWTIANFPDTIAGLNGTGTINILNTTLTVGAGNGSGSFSGVIAGASGNLTKIGTGSLFLNNSNTYTGDTTLDSGIIYLTLAERLADNSDIVVNAGNFNIVDETVSSVFLNGGALGLTDPGPGQLRAQVFFLSAGAVNVPLASGTAVKINAGTVVLNTPNFFPNLSISSGVLEISAENSFGVAGTPVKANGGTLRIVAPMTFTRTFFSGGSPAIECQADVVLRDYRLTTPNTTHGLTKTGPGILTLNCNSVTTGSLSVSGGTVLIDAASALPAVGISTSTGATLQIDGGIVRTTGLSTNNGTLALSGNARFTGGSLNNSGIVEGSGLISSTLFNQAAGDIRVAANESLQFTSLTASTNAGLIDVIGGSAEFAATLTNSASAGLIFARNAILRFTNLTNFGGMAISFGTTDVFGDIDNRAGGTITVSGAANATFVGDVINNGTLRTSAGGNTVFLGAVSGSGSFPGTGTVYLEGDLRPGNSPGLMTFGGDVVLGSFATLIQEIGGNTPSQYDRQQITGDLELDGALNV
jgi:autotransporter-associated beta strand protein